MFASREVSSMSRAASCGRRASKAWACSAISAVSRSVSAISSSMRPSASIEVGGVAGGISAHPLHFKHFPLHGGGHADAAALGDLLGEGVHLEGAESRFALAAAKRTVV